MSKTITVLALIFAVAALGCSRSDNEANSEEADAMAELELYPPDGFQANDKLNDPPNRMIVNVVSDPVNMHDADTIDSVLPRAYMINGEAVDIGDDKTLTDEIRRGVLAAKEADHKEFHVEIRVDHRVKFDGVQAVLKAAAKAGIPGIDMQMSITATSVRQTESMAR